MANSSKETAEALPVPHFEQAPDLCGASALRFVLSYWGSKHSEEELTDMFGSNVDDGVEAHGLLEAADLVGFKGFYCNDADFDDLIHYLDLGIPVIVDWWSTDCGHYFVVVGMDDQYIYLVNPAKDKRFSRMPLDTFKQNWFDFADLEETRDLARRRIIIVTPKDIV